MPCRLQRPAQALLSPAGATHTSRPFQWTRLAALLATAPPPAAPFAAPAAARCRRGRAAMSFPRSLDSHSQEGQKAVAAAAERNKEPILAVLREYLGAAPEGGVFLEVASGTGQHTAHFAAALPHVTFQPTECYTEDGMASIRAWTRDLPNVRPPVVLDASAPASWPVQPASCCAVFAANLTHISPWAATEGLVRGAGRVLAPGGELFIYGPFSVDGQLVESNAAFDASLRQRNAEWGCRDVAQITAEAAAAGLAPVERRGMPANNFLLVYRKQDV